MREATLRIPDLPGALRQLIDQIPRGRVATCGGLARALGNSIAARWVGHFLLHHSHERPCACHRVVRSEGQLGGYVEGGTAAKTRLLAAEGIEVRQDAVDLARYGFDQFVGSRPLEALERLQEEIAARVVLRPRRRIGRLVGAVDVAYPRPGQGAAAYALVDIETGELAWSTSICRPVAFPYITSYLTFRELPILTALLEEVRQAKRLASVVLVDGSGVLHQRHAGIASHLGVTARLATIGVTKKLLCGRADIADMAPCQWRPVVHEDRVIGLAVRPTAGSRRPIFVSPGHRVDLAFCQEVVGRLLVGCRLPEPLYWADRLSRRPCEKVRETPA